MNNQLLHTPDGVRDIYGDECARKLAVQEQIQNVFHLYGYQNIETPAFEFFDIFKAERGSVDSREMYKFFDRENNTLVLRPDITPSIARCVAKYFMDEQLPLRLCYLGSTFQNSTSYRGRLKEATQTGVEMIGDDLIDADAEMIAIAIDALKATGLKEFQVELGQVDFYRGLLEEAHMDEETQDQLRELIENKNYFGVEEILSEQTMSPELKRLFLKLPELFGDIDQIRLAKSMTSNLRAVRAIERLEKIQEILDSYGLGDYVSYDLGMLSKYSYYTGIIFKAYTYGTGDYIVAGGRYDKLLEQFGKSAPAVGFAIEVDRLMSALSRQKICTKTTGVDTMILYEESARAEAIRMAGEFRAEKKSVQLLRKDSLHSFSEYLACASRQKIKTLIYLDGDGKKAVKYSTEDGEVQA
ncbi:ATP phosphoribosyltransferase regulatory subunit [Brotaphodocola sp.]|uniref:ATP phosphoribosyltransferase regulatory subunit n=1 Tax=Brotaphodocola sp. TaxID=3073577 RepID=UPI003D7DB72C